MRGKVCVNSECKFVNWDKEGASLRFCAQCGHPLDYPTWEIDESFVIDGFYRGEVSPKASASEQHTEGAPKSDKIILEAAEKIPKAENEPPENNKKEEAEPLDNNKKDKYPLGKRIFIPPEFFDSIDPTISEIIFHRQLPKSESGSKKKYIETLIAFIEEKFGNKRLRQTPKKLLFFDLGIRDSKGVPCGAFFKDSKNSLILRDIKFIGADYIFDKYIYADRVRMLDDLEKISLRENWNIKGKPQKYLLRNYLIFAFYKSWLDDLIIKLENGDAVFNTGLVDSSYDPIYCLLYKNTSSKIFKYGFFACRGKGVNGKRLNEMFVTFPSAPEYVDMTKLNDLYFDPDKDLNCDWDHIIRDNLKRLPIPFLKTRLSYSKRLLDAISSFEQSKVGFSAIRNIVTAETDEGEQFRRDLQQSLETATETAKRYCRWNYKTAIPVYYPKENKVSLLLPLKLQTDPKVAVDIALVVERLGNGNYQGQTIFTLDMAYQDARLICRPNSEWLTIGNISILGDDEGDDEDE